jgi:hypothetical protein
MARRFAKGERLILQTGFGLETLLEVEVVKPAGVMPYPGDVIVRDAAGAEHRVFTVALHRPGEPLLGNLRAALAERARLRAADAPLAQLSRLDHEINVLKIDMIEAHQHNPFNE